VARATVFDLKKRNIVVSLPIQDFPGGSCVAPDFTGNACFAQVGTFGSRGAELQLEGRLSDSLNVNIYYEVVDAKVLDGGDSIGTVSYPVGNHLADVASRSGSLWVQYSARSGWGIGAGADGMSSRPFNGMNNFTLPGYLQFDAAATYQWKAGPAELRAQINVKNLTGVRTAYDLNWDGTSVLPSAPCTVMASLSARWR
jgi:iron complex outermembrane receptor protein